MHRSWKTSFGYILQFGVHLSSNFPVIFTLCILTRPEDYATVLRLGLVPSAGHRTPICAPAWRQHGHFLFPRYSQSHSYDILLWKVQHNPCITFRFWWCACNGTVLQCFSPKFRAAAESFGSDSIRCCQFRVTGRPDGWMCWLVTA